MRKVVSYVVNAIRSLEHYAMGSADSIVSPLTRIHQKLNTLAEDAGKAADQAAVQASAMRVKAIKAAVAAENIGKVLGK